jgi:hypothetical protein
MPEQLELIDVDDPQFKALKKQIGEYDRLVSDNREQASANRTREKDKRVKVLEAVKAADLTPDANGVYHIKFGGKVWDISQEAQLRIKKHAAKEETPDADEGDDE